MGMILILSDANDQTTVEVIKWLNFFKKPWLRINGEDQIHFNNYILNNERSNVEIEVSTGERINFDKITSYWYRRGHFMFDVPFNSDKIEDEEMKIAISKHFMRELRELSNGIHDVLADKKNINDFRFTDLNKLEILNKARRNGLNIPSTIVTTNKATLVDFRKEHTAIITKAIQNGGSFGFWDSQEVRRRLEFFSYTEEFEDVVPDDFAPTLFQEKINKKYELRVFFINDNFFAMAIFSQLDNQTNIDFRKYNLKKPNRNVPYNLPICIVDKLNALMLDLNLNSGSIDLLVDHSGNYVFLEVNPIGQFGMVSYPCNYYLEKFLANHL